MGIATETLHAKKRETSGTRASRRVRTEGQVPAVLYGHKEAAVPILLAAEEFGEALRHHGRMFELDLDGHKDVVLLKDLQYDSFGDHIIHADFMRIALDETLTLEVPIQLKGVPKIEHAVLQQTLAQVEVECLPKDIPQALVFVVADMLVGDIRRVRDIPPVPGVKILTDPELIVATVTAIIEEVVAAPAVAVPAEGTGVEPEVIGRKAKEEGEEGEEDEEGEKPAGKKKE